MSSLKTRLVEENGLKDRLVEERWHFLVLALLTERAVAAGRSRAARHQNGAYTDHHQRSNGAGADLGTEPHTNGELVLQTNGIPESGEPEPPPGRGIQLLTSGGPKSWTRKLRANGAETNGAFAQTSAPNGAGVVAGVAGVSQGGVAASDSRSVEEAWQRLRDQLRGYFASDHRRVLQTALGLLWLIAGALQFQSFMYSHGFIAMLNDTASGQPNWVASPMHWAANIAAPNLAFFNTLFALTQVAIGLGLLYRQTAKRALLASFGWAMVVWWVGEGFGMLFTDTASPLTGAPGAVLLYAIVGLVAWPNDRPGGLLGVRGVKTAWVVLWSVMAWAWLLGPNSTPDATSDAIRSMLSGLGVVNSVQNAFADAASGIGLVIALLLSLASAAIAAGVALDIHPRRCLKLAIALGLAYWVIGQGFGQIFSGMATDLNTGPVLALLAVAVWPLTEESTATNLYRFGLPPVATGARLGLPQVAFAPSLMVRRAVTLGATAVAIAAIVLIGALSGGGSTSQARNPGSLAGLANLQPPGPPGPIGPEGVPVPSAPPLASPVSTTSPNPAAGIPSCVRQTQIVVRQSIHLTIFVQGFARQIPAGIGIVDGQVHNTPRGTFVAAGNCAAAVHTDAADGIIRIRAPNQRTYTLANFFDVWGQPLNQGRVGPETGPVTVFVNGKHYVGNPRNIPLNGNTQIQLDVGTPLVAPETNTTITDLS